MCINRDETNHTIINNEGGGFTSTEERTRIALKKDQSVGVDVEGLLAGV
jgi:hypothetical protein